MQVLLLIIHLVHALLISVLSVDRSSCTWQKMSLRAKALSTLLDVMTQHTNNITRDERKQPHV